MPLGATMITTTTVAMLGAVVAAVAGAALAPAVLPPAHAVAGEPGTLIFSFGERGTSGPYQSHGILDVDVAPNGKIIVYALSGTGGTLRVFHPNGTLYFMTDTSLHTSWQDRVYAAPDGKIMVCAEHVSLCEVFFPDGTPWHVFEMTFMPHRKGLAFAPNGDFFVVENRSSIGVFRNYTHIYSFGEYGGFYGELSNAHNPLMAPNGKLFVNAGSGDPRIEVFHPNGTHAYSFKPFFGWSVAHDIGPAGELLMRGNWDQYDASFNLFYPNGARAAKIQGDYVHHGITGAFGPNGTIVAKINTYQIGVFNGIGPADTWPPAPSFMEPPGLPVQAPLAYAPPAQPPPTSGTFAFEFGSYGEGPGEFLAPRNIAVGPGGAIAVSDAENDRIQLFHPNGTFAFELGSRGSGPGELIGPYGITFGPNGLLVVADVGNHRVQVFRIQ